MKGVAPARFDADRFRRVLSRFCSGIVIVTGHDADGPAGLTCQSFASLSLEPPLVLFCPAKSSTTWPRLCDAGRFCVNVLGEEQESLSNSFARSGGSKFDQVDWTMGPGGTPRLQGAAAHIDCELHAVHDAGDHEIAVGQVLHVDESADVHPLLYFESRYAALRR
jgi:3-hydroxy-9,10-secoandrosta-1,3,5(10)-triene-9,17-dione monooxygenase reductase component